MDANKINERGVSEAGLGYCIIDGVCVPIYPENAQFLIQKEID